MATVYPLNLGKFKADRGSVTYLEGSGESIYVTATAFLVVDAGRKILVDTGYNEDDTPQVRGFDIERPGGDTQRLPEQLKLLKIKPCDIDDVVNTHLHWDHAGGNHLFPGARFHVQREELRAAFVPDEFMEQYYFRDDFDCGIKYRLYDGNAVISKCVSVVLTPGHTSGHQSVLVKTPKGELIICGDACPMLENWEQRSLAGIHSDPGSFAESLELMQSLGAQPVFCHDLAWHEKRGWMPWD